MKSTNKNDNNDNNDNNKGADFVKMTPEERRAMTKAAWLLGLKVASIGAGLLLAMFMIMQILMYFWNLNL